MEVWTYSCILNEDGSLSSTSYSEKLFFVQEVGVLGGLGAWLMPVSVSDDKSESELEEAGHVSFTRCVHHVATTSNSDRLTRLTLSSVAAIQNS